MVMPIVGMKLIGSVAPALTAGAAGVVVEILLLTCSLISAFVGLDQERHLRFMVGMCHFISMRRIPRIADFGCVRELGQF